jgi:hypothetical protein
MTTQTKKFIISFVQADKKNKPAETFFERAKKHIVKAKRNVDRRLSEKVDEIVYGI